MLITRSWLCICDLKWRRIISCVENLRLMLITASKIQPGQNGADMVWLSIQPYEALATRYESQPLLCCHEACPLCPWPSELLMAKHKLSSICFSTVQNVWFFLNSLSISVFISFVSTITTLCLLAFQPVHYYLSNGLILQFVSWSIPPQAVSTSCRRHMIIALVADRLP